MKRLLIPQCWSCLPLIWSWGHHNGGLVSHRPQYSQEADHYWPKLLTSSTACERHQCQNLRVVAVSSYVNRRSNLIVPLFKGFLCTLNKLLIPLIPPFLINIYFLLLHRLYWRPLLDYSHYFPTLSFHNSLI